MYATGTHQMLHAMEFELLEVLPQFFLTVALVTWGLALVGLLIDLLRRFDLLPGPVPLTE